MWANIALDTKEVNWAQQGLSMSMTCPVWEVYTISMALGRQLEEDGTPYYSCCQPELTFYSTSCIRGLSTHCG